MLVLRCTHKLLKRLGQTPLAIEVTPETPTLGEWLISTIDVLNDGDLYLACMHTETLFTMCLPVKPNMSGDDLAEFFKKELCDRLIGWEIQPMLIQQIVRPYGNQVVIAKNSNRQHTAFLNSIVQDIDQITYSRPEYVVEGNKIIRACLEHRLNTTPRGCSKMRGDYIISLESFWGKLRSMAPQLPTRAALWLHTIPQNDFDRVMRLIVHTIPVDIGRKLAMGTTEVSVLFSAEELQGLLSWIDSDNGPSKETLAEFAMDLRHQAQRALEQLQTEN